MITILKAILALLLLGVIGLIGYAYIGDLRPEQGEIRTPVTLNAGQ